MSCKERLRNALFTFPLVLGLAPGCIFVDDDWEDDDQADLIDDDDDGTAVNRTLECQGEVSVEIEAEADILIAAFRNSLAEMIGCGQLTVDLAGGVRSGILDAIIDNRPDATPAGWIYRGDGVFTSTAAQADMETRFYLASDFAFGQQGDAVEHNVFLVASYLEGARVRVPDPLSFEAELHYDSPGPLVELLGYGTEPPNPIIVDLNTVTGLGDKIAALEFESEVSVEDVDGDATIMYALHTERMAANALLTGAPMRYELDSLVARRDGLDIDVTDWTSEFFNTGTVQGSVRFDIDIEATWSCEGSIFFPELPRTTGD
jgi:hypothetical protein